MVRSLPDNNLNICRPTFFGCLFVGRSFGYPQKQSQHWLQPQDGDVCANLGIDLFVEGWGWHWVSTEARLSFSLPVCFYFLNLQLYTAGMRDGASHSGFYSNKKCNSLLILSPFLAISILSKLWQLLQFRKWTKYREALIFKSLLQGRLYRIREDERQLQSLFFPMIISILFKFMGLWGVCSMWAGSKLYAGITCRKAQGNLKCAFRAQ